MQREADSNGDEPSREEMDEAREDAERHSDAYKKFVAAIRASKSIDEPDDTDRDALREIIERLKEDGPPPRETKNE